MDLVAFLRARYDERAEDIVHDFDCERVRSGAPGTCDCKATKMLRREVEAKRARLDRYERAVNGDLPGWQAGRELIKAGAAILLGVLRDDAAVYRDHPDYDEAWKP